MDYQPLLNYITKHIVLSSQEESILLSKVKHRKYLKGQYLVQQGDICHYLSFVVSGSSKTFHIDKKGKEHIFRFAIENWWAADLPSFIEQLPSNCNVQCLENMEVIQFSFKNLQELYKEILGFEHFFRIIFQNVSVSLEKRIINGLSLSAKSRFLLFRKEYPQFEQRIPQYMIASYLGITKQYLSEIRKEIAYE